MRLIESVFSFVGKKHKGLTALFAVQLLLCGINSPALSKDGVSANEITIGSCCVQSGPASELGKQQLIGAQTYLSYINDKGGVHGRKIVLKTYDDGYEPDKATAAFKKMAGDDCFAGAFFVGTPTAAKYVPLAEEHKLPIIGLFTGAQLLQEPFRPHVISVRASYFDETANQIDHAWKDLGPQKVGVIYQDDAFGNAVLAGVNKALAKHDAKPVATGSFQRNTTDVAKAIATVRAAKPDVVFIVGPYAPVAEVLKESHSQGWRPIFSTVSFVGTEALIKAAGADAEGMVISQVVPPLTRDDLATVVLYKKLLHQYNPSAKPNFTSFEGFVDAMVLVEGLQAAGKDLTREKLVQSIESIKDKDMGLGPNLKLSYGPTRHKGFDQVYTTVVRDGQTIAFFNWKLVKPKG
ncbi:MAG TPA: ABC transporter substrate-binding protein [Candidatus Obscuribacterales bacterium]